MFSMYTYIFFYYLICTLQLVQLDIRYIFLALLLINMWMATPRGYHLPVFFFYYLIRTLQFVQLNIR